MFDFKTGFLAKFCVIEGVSEIMCIYIIAHPLTAVQQRYRVGQSYQKNGRA